MIDPSPLLYQQHANQHESITEHNFFREVFFYG